jgi:hypothetical protein
MTNPFRQKDSGTGIPTTAVEPHFEAKTASLTPKEDQEKASTAFPGPPTADADHSTDSDEDHDVEFVIRRVSIDRRSSADSLYREDFKVPKHPKNHQSNEQLDFSGAPPNPFAKTLATLEGRDQLSEDVEEQNIADRPRIKTRNSKGLDVDTFKNLLLTGKPPQSASDSAPKWKSVQPSDSTSSTETSSISRQSLTENPSDFTGETPRSSYDVSWPDDSVKAKSDRQKPPPPPPKSKHGRSLLSKVPQTVSFDDFAPSIPSETSSLSGNVSNQSLVSSPGSKSLPSPPTPNSKRLSYIQPLDIKSDENQPLTNASQKKSAPPIPLARRSTVTKRARGNTTSSITSVTEEAPSSYPPSIADSTSSSKLAPPPPPSRRLGSGNNVQISVSPQEPSKEKPPEVRSFDPKPPNAPTRNRSSSQTSLMSPPPPPTRRRSSKASIESSHVITGSTSQSRRSSTEVVRSSIDSQRRVCSGQQDPPILEETDADHSRPPVSQNNSSSSGKDILADMDAFAKELEQLRNQYEGT